MSITDELRKWAEDNTLRDRELTTCPPQHVVRGVLETLLRIADRIDAEYERLMQEQPFTVDMVPMTDENMAEHGWVRLPKDADGVPIRIGDRVMHKSLVKPVVVVGVGNDDFFYQNGAGFNWFFHAHEVHHHDPTVEDVLREFAHVGIRIVAKNGIKAGEFDFYADEEAIAEYAAKLTLRGDE